jgi:diguanylate cyclase (GGDEF)-like protein
VDKKSLNYQRSSVDEKGQVIRKFLDRGINAVVALPLITQSEVIGILILASNRSGAYNPDQVRLLEQLASQISTSVVNSQLYSSAEKRARIDELTGLSNRRHFDETIDKEIQRHFRYGSMLSMILIDVDQLKAYNDLLGHLKGDKLLKKIGQIIRHNARDVDMNFRYGGDEFAILLPSTSVENAVAVAERIRQTVEKEAQSENIPFSLSLGWLAGLMTASPSGLNNRIRPGLISCQGNRKEPHLYSRANAAHSGEDKDNVSKEAQ